MAMTGNEVLGQVGGAALRGTYCNPLSLAISTMSVPSTAPATATSPAGRGGRGLSLADPTVFRHKGKYYLYATGGAAWVSDDLVNWRHHPVSIPGRRGPIGPSIVECKGTFYLVDNNAEMYRARDPLGPWESLGPVKDENGDDIHWADWMLFLDDDGTMYAYHNSDKGIGSDGVFVTRLDPKADFARTIGPTVNCFAYNKDHVWERRGEKNEDASASWIEAGWMTKHKGRYYLQYSAPGTEFTTYAVGVYASESPTGPFTYDPASPILRGKGLLNGTGHHAVVEGPDGNLWAVYHVLVGNQGRWERRLALDRVVFDKDGRMTIAGPTETPQWAPSSGKSGDAGLVALSVGKKAEAGDAAKDHPAGHAFDDRMRTWWEPAGASVTHWLSVDLGEVCEVEATRLIFYRPGPFRYRIEVSTDGQAWTAVADKTGNTVPNCHEYDTFERANTRYVRVTITGKPEGVPIRVIELTVFGKKP